MIPQQLDHSYELFSHNKSGELWLSPTVVPVKNLQNINVDQAKKFAKQERFCATPKHVQLAIATLPVAVVK